MKWALSLALLLGLSTSAVILTADLPVEDPIWWLTNDRPPSLTVQGPSGPLRGATEGLVRLEPAGRAELVSASVDGQPARVEGARIVIDSTALPDGLHRVVATARDSSRRANEATAEWSFRSDNSGPRLDVRLDPAPPTEGQAMVVRVTPSEPLQALAGEVEGRALQFQDDGKGGRWALVGFPPDTTPASQTVSLRATDALGNTAAWTQSYPFARTPFPEEVLEFDPSLNLLTDRQVRAQEMAQLLPVYTQPNGEKRWQGLFQAPVVGEITTQFATKRSYQGNATDYDYHSGTDLAAPMGAPVAAPAAGIVAYVATVPVRGNIVVLDHGAGVYSTYAHLQRAEVQVGQTVRPGQVIARVGSTGFSTGPHLHWEIWVQGANVDPMEWTKRPFP